MTQASGIGRRDVMDAIAALPAGSLRVASSAERKRAAGGAGWIDCSYLELAGTSEGLRALAAALLAIADAGEGRAVSAMGQGGGIASHEWASISLSCWPTQLSEAAPAAHVAVIERHSEGHRRDKLVVEVQNRLASTIRVSGYRFETETLRSAGNADQTIHGGRTGRFAMFVPSDTRELELWVDGFTDLAAGGAAWTIGHAARTLLPARATRGPLEDRIM